MSSDDPIIDHYTENLQREWGRSDEAYHRLEYLTALKLIEAYFPDGGRLADIGGGPGRYAIEMMRRGWHVTLVDITPSELKLAEQKIEEAGLVAENIIEASATDLPMLYGEYFDAALLMGPLYHLPHEGRMAALEELYRILKPGGVALVTYLNSWGMIRHVVRDFVEMAEDILAMQGAYKLGIWHWTPPPDALAEVIDAGFEVITRAAAEGFLGGLIDNIEKVRGEHPTAYATIVKAAVEMCEAPHFRDSSEHLHVVVWKQQRV